MSPEGARMTARTPLLYFALYKKQSIFLSNLYPERKMVHFSFFPLPIFSWSRWEGEKYFLSVSCVQRVMADYHSPLFSQQLQESAALVSPVFQTKTSELKELELLTVIGEDGESADSGTEWKYKQKMSYPSTQVIAVHHVTNRKETMEEGHTSSQIITCPHHCLLPRHHIWPSITAIISNGQQQPSQSLRQTKVIRNRRAQDLKWLEKILNK